MALFIQEGGKLSLQASAVQRDRQTITVQHDETQARNRLHILLCSMVHYCTFLLFIHFINTVSFSL